MRLCRKLLQCDRTTGKQLECYLFSWVEIDWASENINSERQSQINTSFVSNFQDHHSPTELLNNNKLNSKMKLTPVFIAIVSLVGLSQQQRFLNEQWMSSYFAPRHQFPSVYLIPGGYVYQHSPQSQPAINYPIDYQNDEGVETEQSIDASYYDNQGRVKAKTFLFGNMLSSLISASLAALNQRSLTSTTFTTVVQTATIASVQNCLAAAQFANAAAQANPCRRRRGISTEEIEAPESIAPSEIQSLEATLEPRQRRSETIPEISSSQEQEQSSLTLRGGRGITIVTVTSPTTSFVFSTTTIKKNVNLGNAAQLLCLPAGFTVC